MKVCAFQQLKPYLLHLPKHARCIHTPSPPPKPPVILSPLKLTIPDRATTIPPFTSPSHKPSSRVEPKTSIPKDKELLEALSVGLPRWVFVGGASLGLALLLLAIDGQEEALALGPEGPLVEEFWDNMRRYGLYILTVSTGAIYTILQPIVELLKNPISAILILIVVGGSFYLVSQVLTAMFGISEFAYDYGY